VLTLAAAAPILVILLLMLGLRWSAAAAGLAGAAVAVITAVLAFDFPAAAAPGIGADAAFAGTLAEAGFTALAILWIIGPALGIHELQLRTGAASVLRSALAGFAPDPRILALLVAWFFVLFMEGAAGFGASVALAAPFLVAAGFRAIDAVAIALIGHVVGVSFGAVGTPILPQIAATGASGLDLARASGIYQSLLGWLPLVVLVAIVQRSAPATLSPLSPAGGIPLWTALAFLCFMVPYTLLWMFVGPELPTLGGALFGGLAFVAALRLAGAPPATVRATSPSDGPLAAAVLPVNASAGAVLRAAAPYLVLLALVLLTRLVADLRTALQQVVLHWQLHGGFSGSFELLYHPGSILLAGFISGALLQRASPAQVRGAISAATRRLLPVAIALLAMLAMASIMVHAGMTGTLALAAAGAAGGAWPAIAPAVGALGSFVTGSATASNILFSELQQETALQLGLDVVDVAGAQNFGAAVGNMICPHNVIAACATVGLAGQESTILRRTLPVALACIAAGGALALLLAR
jgi:lactate permease